MSSHESYYKRRIPFESTYIPKNRQGLSTEKIKSVSNNASSNDETQQNKNDSTLKQQSNDKTIENTNEQYTNKYDTINALAFASLRKVCNQVYSHQNSFVMSLLAEQGAAQFICNYCAGGYTILHMALLSGNFPVFFRILQLVNCFGISNSFNITRTKNCRRADKPVDTNLSDEKRLYINKVNYLTADYHKFYPLRLLFSALLDENFRSGAEKIVFALVISRFNDVDDFKTLLQNSCPHDQSLNADFKERQVKIGAVIEGLIQLRVNDKSSFELMSHLDIFLKDLDECSLIDRIFTNNLPELQYILVKSRLISSLDAFKVSIEGRMIPPLCMQCFYNSITDLSMITCIAKCLEYSSWNHLYMLTKYPGFLSLEGPILQIAEREGWLREMQSLLKLVRTNSGCSIFIEKLESTRNTVIFTSLQCLEHNKFTKTDVSEIHNELKSTPENSLRYESLLNKSYGVLYHDNRVNKLKRINVNTNIVLSDILRVHNPGYIDAIKACLKKIDLENLTTVHLDNDTVISRESWNSCCAAAECVKRAIKHVVKRNCRNAFCVVRPPGHHVGVYGAAQLPGKDNDGDDPLFTLVKVSSLSEINYVGQEHGSLGFCLLNNVAIGAAWARNALYDQGIRRISIVDFDIHHGNGTQQIIQSLTQTKRIIKTKAKMGSMINAGLIVQIPCSNVWYDESDYENIQFISIHGYNGSFYPATGPDNSDEFCERHNSIVNVCLKPNSTESDFMELFRTRVTSKLLDFKPNLILLSSGFDAHKSDSLGGSFACLTEQSFRILTKELVKVANKTCNGRIVSVLEGGYNCALKCASPLAQSVVQHIIGLNYTSTRY